MRIIQQEPQMAAEEDRETDAEKLLGATGGVISGSQSGIQVAGPLNGKFLHTVPMPQRTQQHLQLE